TEDDKQWDTAARAGSRAYKKGHLDEAEAHFLKAIELSKKFDDVDPRIGTGLSNLASIYKAKGELEKAEPLYLQSLENLQKTLPKEHMSIAAALENLGALYDAEGRRAKAESYYKRALEMKQKLLGDKHAEVANDMTA